jgi:DUF4097 and DUF4098 domain-containing protein YvlB
MNRRLILLGLFIVAGCTIASGAATPGPGLTAGGDSYFGEREEIRQSYELSAGARVTVANISGPVEIETTAGSTAEVHVIRTARSQADLQYRRVIIEHTGSSLTVRGENDRGMARGVQVNQHVMLKLPVNVDLSVNSISGHAILGDVGGRAHISSISGPVTIGDVSGEAIVASVSGHLSIGRAGGQVQVRSISGSVDIAEAVGHLEASSISGSVKATVSRIGPGGININSISGGVTLRLHDAVNAEINCRNYSGEVYLNVPNVVVQGKMTSSEVRGLIGAGGPAISISNVSGSITLQRAE